MRMEMTNKEGKKRKSSTSSASRPNSAIHGSPDLIDQTSEQYIRLHPYNSPGYQVAFLLLFVRVTSAANTQLETPSVRIRGLQHYWHLETNRIVTR